MRPSPELLDLVRCTLQSHTNPPLIQRFLRAIRTSGLLFEIYNPRKIQNFAERAPDSAIPTKKADLSELLLSFPTSLPLHCISQVANAGSGTLTARWKRLPSLLSGTNGFTMLLTSFHPKPTYLPSSLTTYANASKISLVLIRLTLLDTTSETKTSSRSPRSTRSSTPMPPLPLLRNPCNILPSCIVN